MSDQSFTLKQCLQNKAFSCQFKAAADAKLDAGLGSIQITIEDCSLAEFEALRQTIEQVKQSSLHEPSSETIPEVKIEAYQAYLPELKQSPLFKPANPRLAIHQLAKQYDLDVQLLSACYKAYK